MGGNILAFNHAVMPNHRRVPYLTIKQDGIKPDKDMTAYRAGAMHDRAMGNRAVLSNDDGRPILGVNDHTILNIGIGTNDNGFQMPGFIELVSPDNGIRADENMGANLDATA